MNKFLTVSGGAAVAVLMAFAPSAASQTPADGGATTPADAPVSVNESGVVPADSSPSTTVADIAPVVESPTTLAPPVTDSTVATVPVSQVPTVTDSTLPPLGDFQFDQSLLLGDHIAAGTLNLDLEFGGGALCQDKLSLAGQVNSLTDSTQNASVVYGLADNEGGKAAVLVAGLGIFPVGIAVVSVASKGCQADAIGIGPSVVDGRSVSVNGIGLGLPGGGATLAPDYVRKFSVSATVESTDGPAKLDLGTLSAHLTRQR